MKILEISGYSEEGDIRRAMVTIESRPFPYLRKEEQTLMFYQTSIHFWDRADGTYISAVPSKAVGDAISATRDILLKGETVNLRPTKPNKQQ